MKTMTRTVVGSAVALSAALSIVTPTLAAPRDNDVREERRDVKEARKELKRQRREARDADTPQERRRERRDVQEAREDVREERQELRRERRDDGRFDHRRGGRSDNRRGGYRPNPNNRPGAGYGYGDPYGYGNRSNGSVYGGYGNNGSVYGGGYGNRPNGGVYGGGYGNNGGYFGTVTRVHSAQNFDIDINGNTFNVYTDYRLPRGLSEGDTVRVSGNRVGKNDIRNATVTISRNR